MGGSGTFVYVSHHEEQEIFVLRLNTENGKLTPVQKVSVPGRAKPLTVSPDRRTLFLAIRSKPYHVESFAIDPSSGKLTHLGDAPLPESMAYISTDRTGRFLFATAIPDNKLRPRPSVISVSAIGPTGFVQPPHQIVRTQPKAHCILADPANRYVLVSCCDADIILRQVFDANTGMFSPNALTPVRLQPNAGPRHFMFHPNNRFVYVVNEKDATLYTFGYDANAGALNELQVSTVVPPNFKEKEAPKPADIHLTPDGKFLYASERTSSTLAAFKVNLSSGMLTPIGNFKTEERPHSFHIDPQGRCLLVPGERSHRMTSYAIDRETGKLTKLKEYALGKGPNCVKIVNLP